MASNRQAFYELDDFPRLAAIADAWPAMHAEFSRLDAPIMPINRQGKSHETVVREVVQHVSSGHTYGWMHGWGMDGPNRDWMQYGLVAGGKAVPWAVSTMPETVRLLASTTGVQTAALSWLRKHTLLSTHTHPELERERLLQMHVTLTETDERNYAYFNVAGEFRHYSSRNAFVFDGSNDHFAVNASSTDRVILYLEFKRDALYEPATARQAAGVQ
ncbi:MAG: aspartyl/asparaginyl beta-hydroxylase domain-containing protein [Janthinobacterium lividum]